MLTERRRAPPATGARLRTVGTHAQRGRTIGDIDAAAATDIGKRRDRNEDAWLVDDDRRLYVVADGMGGHPAGDVASRVAVDSLASTLTDDALHDRVGTALDDALRSAHEAVLRAAAEPPGERGMGTTVVVAHLPAPAERAVVAHVGDSRAYLVRDGEAARLTRDHTTDGLFGRSLTQALGTPGELQPDVSVVDLVPGDRLLLCTDGLTDLVGDDRIAALVAEAADADAATEALVTAALDEGGHDNVTVVVVDVA